MERVQTPTAAPAGSPPSSIYFEFQAAAGLTKHIGGASATDDLAALCHLQPGQRMLDVGCGVGISARYFADKLGLNVTGVDLRPAMIERARANCDGSPAAVKPDFRVADAESLPFDDETFDAVVCESVLAFVPDRARALRELIRVTRPGGWVGFTEAFWASAPNAAMEAYFRKMEPSLHFEPSSTWEALLAGSGLTEPVVHINASTNPMKDARNQLKRVGLGPLLRAWGRSLTLLADGRYRRFMLGAGKLANKNMNSLGYGVYVGRKPG